MSPTPFSLLDLSLEEILANRERSPNPKHKRYTRVYEINNATQGEDLENYEKHGFHPVEIDETYHAGKYRILNKLGCGGSSTVWVAQNTNNKQLYALKFLSSRASAKSREVEKTLRLQALLSVQPHIARLIDHFHIQGPNCSSRGVNKVLVFDIHGSSINRLSYEQLRLHGRVVQSVMYKTTKALVELHKAGIVHRDLTPQNILLQLDPRVSSYSPESLYAKFGQPRGYDIYRTDGKDPKPFAPSQSYTAIDCADPDILLPDPVLIDFGESEDIGRTTHKRRSIPAMWAAPEAIFENKVDPSCDVWSLGCIIYRARSGNELFPGGFFGGFQAYEVAHQMIYRLGSHPPFASWKAAEFDERDRVNLPSQYKLRSGAGRDNETWIQDLSDPSYPVLEVAVRSIRDRPSDAEINELFWSSRGPYSIPDEELDKFPHISPQEADLFYDLLSRIFVWDPAKRISAADLLNHPWFHFQGQ